MTKSCERCGAEFPAQRSTARFCGPACKKAGQRARRAEQAAGTVTTVEFGPVTRATARELEAGGVLDSVSGQVALVLARLLDRAGPASGSSVAAWSKELAAVMARAREESRNRRKVDDPVTRARAAVAAKRGLTPVS